MPATMSPKLLLLVIYAFIFIMFISQVPINEYTLPKVVAAIALFVVGLALILGWHFIIPSIIRKWRLGNCVVHQKKYIICQRTGGGAEVVGYVLVKVVPEQPVADMDKERRESFLQTMQGLLAGTQFEAGVCYIGMRDRYHRNIIQRLQEQKSRRLMFMGRQPSPAARDYLERIDRELRILQQVPVILEGFYILIIRDYAMTEDELIQKLEADARALASKLEGLGTTTEVLEGEQLRAIADFIWFGSIGQTTV